MKFSPFEKTHLDFHQSGFCLFSRRVDLLHAASSMIGVGGVMLGLSHFPPNGEINAEHGVFYPQNTALARSHSYAHLHPLDGVAFAASEGLGVGSLNALSLPVIWAPLAHSVEP